MRPLPFWNSRREELTREGKQIEQKKDLPFAENIVRRGPLHSGIDSIKVAPSRPPKGEARFGKQMERKGDTIQDICRSKFRYYRFRGFVRVNSILEL